MSTLNAFNSVVAARTRAADQILRLAELLAVYEACGGLREDLVAIRDAGQRAELLDGAQSAAQAAGGAATSDVLTAFAALQADYKAVMAVAKAVQGDLARADADAATQSAIAKILVNEAEVSLRSVSDGVDADGKARSKKVSRPKVSQEALRAEIARDAAALAALKPAASALTKRKVTAKRLARLQADAAALAGKLADRAVSKAGSRTATAAEGEAVASQRALWGACYRLLAAAGRDDHRIETLIREGARKK